MNLISGYATRDVVVGTGSYLYLYSNGETRSCYKSLIESGYNPPRFGAETYFTGYTRLGPATAPTTYRLESNGNRLHYETGTIQTVSFGETYSDCIVDSDISVYAASATFTSLTCAANSTYSRLSSTGDCGITSTNACVYVSWSGTGVAGLYNVLSTATKSITVDYPYVLAHGVPTVSVVSDTITIFNESVSKDMCGYDGVCVIHGIASMDTSSNTKLFTVSFENGSSLPIISHDITDKTSVCLNKRLALRGGNKVIGLGTDYVTPGYGTTAVIDSTFNYKTDFTVKGTVSFGTASEKFTVKSLKLTLEN